MSKIAMILPDLIIPQIFIYKFYGIQNGIFIRAFVKSAGTTDKFHVRNQCFSLIEKCRAINSNYCSTIGTVCRELFCKIILITLI